MSSNKLGIASRIECQHIPSEWVVEVVVRVVNTVTGDTDSSFRGRTFDTRGEDDAVNLAMAVSDHVAFIKIR